MISATTAPVTTLADAGQLQAWAKNTHISEATKRAEAAKMFESTFLRQFLSESLEPQIKGFLPESGPGSDVYRYFLTDALSSSICSRGGLGVANLIQCQLQHPPGMDADPAPSLP